MNKLITDLLEYSRLSSNVVPECTDLNLILKEVLLDFDHLTEEKNAIINLETMPRIKGIPSQLRQLFQNLIGNSLKFSKEGIAPEIDITAELVEEKDFESKASPSGNYCKITVKDNGIGFDENTSLKFSSFFKA